MATVTRSAQTFPALTAPARRASPAALRAFGERRDGAARDAQRLEYLAGVAPYPQAQQRLHALARDGRGDVAALDALSARLGGPASRPDPASFEGHEQDAWSLAVDAPLRAATANRDLRLFTRDDAAATATLEGLARGEHARRRALVELAGRTGLAPLPSVVPFSRAERGARARR